MNFPIALLMAAALAELLKMLTGRVFFDAPARYCIWLGAGTAISAAVLGWCCGRFHVSDSAWLMTTHRWLGTSTAGCAVLLLAVSEIKRRRTNRLGTWFRVTLFGTAAMVGITGYFGGALVFGLDHYAWPE